MRWGGVMGKVVRLDDSRRALATVESVDQAKVERDKVAAFVKYMEDAGYPPEQCNEAAELVLDFERVGGGFFREVQRAQGDRTDQQTSPNVGRSFTNGFLAECKRIGLSNQDAYRWERLNEIPPDRWETLKARHREHVKTKGRRGIITTTAALREHKEAEREKRRAENAAKVADTPSIDTITAQFPTIVIDPPWDWKDEGDHEQLGRGRHTYQAMTIEELMAFPVGRLADDDCHLYLWITNRSLPKGFGLIDAWGFRYVTCLTWCKPSFGMGNYFRGQTEQVLFAIKGSQPLLRKDVGTWFEWDRPGKGHSGKPDEFFELVETCSPGPRLEIFARGLRDGWTVWGAEAEND